MKKILEKEFAKPITTQDVNCVLVLPKSIDQVNTEIIEMNIILGGLLQIHHISYPFHVTTIWLCVYTFILKCTEKIIQFFS